MKNPDRIESFKADIEDMKLKSSSQKERGLQLLAVLLMVGGVITGFSAYFSSTHQDDFRDQNELIILAIASLSLVLIGAVMFVRYSLAKFLRFWLLRQFYEGQDHIDRIVNAMVESPDTGADSDETSDTPGG
jgi:hypothetical protein